jgi:hypothetical protein
MRRRKRNDSNERKEGRTDRGYWRQLGNIVYHQEESGREKDKKSMNMQRAPLKAV